MLYNYWKQEIKRTGKRGPAVWDFTFEQWRSWKSTHVVKKHNAWMLELGLNELLLPGMMILQTTNRKFFILSIDPDPQQRMNVENVHPQPEVNEQMLMSNEQKSDLEISNIASPQDRSLSKHK